MKSEMEELKYTGLLSREDRLCSTEYGCQKCSERSTMGSGSNCVLKKSYGYLIIYVILVVILHNASAQNLKVDTENLVNSMDFGKQEAATHKSSPVSLMWGIADTSATVGKIFHYGIPNDAFKGDILKYKITEAGRDKLPDWLYFDEQSKSLKGIATPDDTKHHYIEVIAQGHGASQAKDVFSITVSSEASAHHIPTQVSIGNMKPQVIKCKTEQPETTVTIVLDVDMKDMSAQDRLTTIQKFEKYLKLTSEMMKLLPLGGRSPFDSSALVAGPGDVKSQKTSGVTVSWLVGCGKVEEDHMKILQKVESSSADGTMKSETGHPVIGWHVTYTANHLKPRRKRAIRATATPVQTPSPPTDLPDKVMTDLDIKPSASADPLSRTVPSMDSPGFQMTSMIKPTKTVDMPSFIPMASEDTGHMMTKIITEAPKPTFKPVVTTDVLQPSEGPDGSPKGKTTTQILPSRSFVVTDAPTSVTPPVTKKPETDKPDPPPVTKKPSVNCPPDNQPRRPFVTGKTQRMAFSVGQETVYSIPNDLYTDCLMEGGTAKLRLTLLNGTEALPRNYWLTLVRRSEGWKLIGFPLAKHLGWTGLTLAAENKFEIGPAFHNIIVGAVQSELLVGEPSHKISMVFEGNFRRFNNKKLIDMTEKVANLFSRGNNARDQITVLDVTSGSIVYSWTNNTLPTDNCPVNSINDMVRKLINGGGTLKKSARVNLQPLVLKDVAVDPLGACEQNVDFPKVDTRYFPTRKPVDPDTKQPTRKPDTTPEPATPEPATPKPTKKPMKPPQTTTDSEMKGEAQGSSDDEIWITTVVPAVVIVAILLIALIIACILYRKSRKGKMSLEDQHTFVNKGAPVIFPDEYDEKPNDSTRPLIMNDEKPPMPPPEYTRASSESSRSSDQKNEEFEEHEMNETDVTSPLYRPPPPVQSTGNNKQPRPHMQPAYKNPAPYVPP